MKLRSVVMWRTRLGKRRPIRLYKAWRNMHDRVQGHVKAGNGTTPWKGLEVGFTDFEHFRAWSLANGYSRGHNSLDRIDPSRGYTPENCRWVSVRENSQSSYGAILRGRGAGNSYTPF